MKIRQRRLQRERVDLDPGFALVLGHPRQRGQRQAQAHRRVAGGQVDAVAAEAPQRAVPALVQAPGQRQDEAGRRVEAARQLVGEVAAHHRIVDVEPRRIEVDRQFGFLLERRHRILVGRLRVARGEPEMLRQGGREALGVAGGMAVIPAGFGQQRFVLPYRQAVAPPVQTQRPARQWLARIPLALAGVQQRAGRQLCLEPSHQHLGAFALVLSQCIDVPFRCIHVVDRDEGGLAAVGQTNVHGLQLLVDRMPQRQQGLPRFVAEGQGDARVLADAGDGIGKLELDLARVGHAVDRRGGRRLRRAGERDVALAGEQPGGRVEADPAGARQIYLGPGMQVGEVVFGAGRAVERFFVGGELHQVARDEARRESQMTQDLHQQPGRVAARAERFFQRLLAALDAGLHADGVGDVALQALVERDQEIVAVHPFARHFRQRRFPR